ncbi:hypothetical protein OU787_32520 [Kitasatospora sp. YST-16]|uniref:hypothetical protein n=1 Tax=Kitasatospora sp. YST-16 TaxID=2998080 RepID=UPI002283BFC2|nr:hypothetical protein [Kitasatospora sp. YST-16]WAL75853.1 hypothetical protein OU787_32520 [Kitasatospora sp. YST-16]WNW41914.1 hypothetical protein RKE32_32435 [Streptomyces sp. Li-HN-5-13]
MTVPGISTALIPKLPVQVFPRPCEGVEAFIARLAEANFLKPSQLRSYLCDPPGHRSTISWPRLIAATGRSLEELQNTLERTPPWTITHPACDYCGRRPQRGERLQSHPWWCSPRCRRRSLLLDYAPSSRNVLPGQKVTLVCIGCGTQVIRRANSTRNTCSKRCHAISVRLREAELALYENPNAVEPDDV